MTLVAVPLNAVLNRALVFGVAGWPSLRLTCAGLSSLVVACVALALFAAQSRRCGYRGLAPGLDIGAIREMLRLGVPIGIAAISEIGVFLCATLFVATLSVADAAAHAIGIRTAGVVYAVSLGLLQASTARIAARPATPSIGWSRRRASLPSEARRSSSARASRLPPDRLKAARRAHRSERSGRRPLGSCAA